MADRIHVENKCIGENEPVFIIAEIGSNHNQDIEIAKKLIDTSADAGADAVKFQLFDADELYQPQEELYAVFKEIQLNKEWITELKQYASSKGLVFFASPFDEKSIHILHEHDVSMFKWASSETTNLRNLYLAAGFGKPMIISIGMCDMADIYEAVEVCKTVGNNQIVLLHTSSLYPTNAADVNLKTIQTLRNIFNTHVGFSDHTLNSTAAIMAVAIGATVIEKHITLDKEMKGPDHFYAAEPEEFRRYVTNIREAETSMGTDKIEMHPDVKKIARRESIHARVDIEKGSVLTSDMLMIKRPAIGIQPRYMKALLGAKARERISKDSPIHWEQII